MRRTLVPVLAVLLCSVPILAADVQLRTDRTNAVRAVLSTADFNGDGLDDILSLHEGDRHGLQFNLGGRFAPAIFIDAIPAAANPDSPDVGVRAVANFNGDAFADLLVGRGRSDDLVLLGNGSGGFTPRAISKEHGWAVEAVDFTGDGFGDLLQWKPGQLTIQRGRGDGTFVFHQSFPWEGSYYLGMSPPAADLNGDGRRDFLLTTDRTIRFYFGQPDGTFAVRERFVLYGPSALQLGDLNGDGNIDIGFVSRAQDQRAISALYGDGTGRFPGYARRVITDNSWSEGSADARNIVIGDFVAGGAQELAYGTLDGHIVVLSGIGDQLREVGRVQVEGAFLQVLSMRFRSAAPELLASGHIRVHANVATWHVAADGSIDGVQSHARARAMGRITPAITSQGTFRLDITSTCPISGLDEWTFEREGLFVDFAPSDVILSAKAAYLPGELYVELLVKDGTAIRELIGWFTPAADGLSGKLYEWKPSPCGRWTSHRVKATPLR